MTPDEQHDRARNRFILINLAQIGATVVVLAAILLWQSNVFVEGGSIIGLPIALAGLVGVFAGPRYLARKWRTPPGE